jgi:hypothetical protein
MLFNNDLNEATYINHLQKINTMKIQSEAFLISDNTQWKNAGEGMQRMILGYDDRIMMVKMHFDAKAEGSINDLLY